jgi:hypothetical protein
MIRTTGRMNHLFESPMRDHDHQNHMLFSYSGPEGSGANCLLFYPQA